MIIAVPIDGGRIQELGTVREAELTPSYAEISTNEKSGTNGLKTDTRTED
jgi:hypothetical protein